MLMKWARILSVAMFCFASFMVVYTAEPGNDASVAFGGALLAILCCAFVGGLVLSIYQDKNKTYYIEPVKEDQKSAVTKVDY